MNYLASKFRSLTRKTRVVPVAGSWLLVATVLVSTIATVQFFDPKVAHASCDPRVIDGVPVTPSYPPEIYSVNSPVGTFEDPQTIPVQVVGQGGYECTGPPSGGMGWEMVNVSVGFTIRNSGGQTVHYGTWHAQACTVPICIVRAINTDVQVNVSTWPEGVYTFTARATGAGGSSEEVSTQFIIDRTGGVGANYPGSLNLTVPQGTVDSVLPVTGQGIGGMWRRGRIFCPAGDVAYGFLRRELATANERIPTPPPLQTLPTYETRYEVDGVDVGPYVLDLTDIGSDEPISCPSPGGFSPVVYDFAFNVNTSALSNGQHTLTVKAWDGSTSQVISRTATFNVLHAPGGIGLACNTVQQVVTAGQAATYSVTVNSQNGFSGPVQIGVVSGLPAGASSSQEVVNVPAGGSASALVTVTTATTSPASTSTLTFRATGAGVEPSDCLASLVIRDPNPANPPRVLLAANPQAVRSGETSTPYWTISDGLPQTCTRTASPANSGWSGSISGSQVAMGSHTGEPITITAPTTLSMSCTNAHGEGSATTTVTVLPDTSGATFQILPRIQQVPVGQTVNFDAWYDPDGPGSQERQNVTGSSTWDVTNAGVASVSGTGQFRGVSVGQTPIGATWGSMSDTATLTVVSGGQCTFSASPATLFIPPLRATTLSWQCGAPVTACTVSRVTAPGGAVASGGASGSGPDSPRHTTTYRLTCDGGVQQDLTVRVFDVTTRIEILPR
jgi:hypothetical protein